MRTRTLALLVLLPALGARALIAVAFALILAAPAAAAPLRSLPPEHGNAHPISDGVRYVLLSHPPGIIRVLDTRTGRGRDVTVRGRCTARGATANWGLVGCDDDTNPWLMRLSTRRMAPIGFGPPGDSGSSMQWNGIGRHWLQGSYHVNRPVVVYTHWRADERHRGGGFSGDGFESPRFDLDDPKLRPISNQHAIFDRDGDAVLKDLRKAHRTDTTLVLDRGRRRAVLSRCRTGCTQGTLSGGVATWHEAGIVHAYVERTGRRHSWDVPRRFPGTVVHTRTHVLAAWSEPEPPYTPRVFWARIPR
jgi:hypothetical protein